MRNYPLYDISRSLWDTFVVCLGCHTSFKTWDSY